MSTEVDIRPDGSVTITMTDGRGEADRPVPAPVTHIRPRQWTVLGVWMSAGGLEVTHVLPGSHEVTERSYGTWAIPGIFAEDAEAAKAAALAQMEAVREERATA